MSRTIFAANWKMHHGPVDARTFMRAFLPLHRSMPQREIWIFPPAVSLESVAQALRDHGDMLTGAQNIYWEPQGAFTGELSAPLAHQAGARAVLVGHSERRHVFGETVPQTAKKIRAAIDGALIPVLCVGERTEEREAGTTTAVIEQQLAALDDCSTAERRTVIIAYEPVWAIGTGHTATPDDAATVHRTIRASLVGRGVEATEVTILYGGSVNPANAAVLLREPEINGVLVGGASLDPAKWRAITTAGLD